MNQPSPTTDSTASIWAMANAGAGKTYQLTSRVLALLLDGVPPDAILCITYTNNAAAEMRARLFDVVRQWALMEEEELQNSVQTLLQRPADAGCLRRARSLFALLIDAPGSLKIQTLHSFCQSLLGRFPLEAGLHPEFTVIDEIESRRLTEMAMITLTQQQEGLDAHLAVLAELFAESTLQDYLRSVVTQKDDWLDWLDIAPDQRERQLKESLNAELEEAPSSIANRVFDYREDEKHALIAAVHQLQMSDKKTDLKRADALRDWLEALMDGVPDADIIQPYSLSFLTKEGSVLKTLASKATPAETYALLQQEAQRCQDYNEQVNAQRVYRYTISFWALAEALLAVYQQLKEARGVLDYHDLILRARNLLNRADMSEWVLFKLDGGITHIQIDEAQDTSPAQWQIIQALTQEFFAGHGKQEQPRSLFVVGDEKQSIFSFQGADVAHYRQMHNYFKQRIEAARKPFIELTLQRSYRSTPAVLNAVDALAAQMGIAAQHEATRTDSEGIAALWPLIEKPDAAKRSPWQPPTSNKEPTRHALLAEYIATQIEGWLSEKRLIVSTGQPITPADILILVRRRDAFLPIMTERLAKSNIHVSSAGRMQFSKHLAAQDMLALGHFLLLPSDDYSLACVLKSPLFNISEADLFQLAYGRKEASLWQCLTANQTLHPGAHTLLSALLEKADNAPPYQLFAYLLKEQNKQENYAHQMGNEALQVLDFLLEQALLYQQSGGVGLMGFLRLMLTSPIEIKTQSSNDAHQLRIMTVHGAKGLEAPIVILPDTTSLPKSPKGICWHRDEKHTMPIWMPPQAQGCLFANQIREVSRQATLEEYHRLLYVAATRARDELYICGSIHTKKLNEQCWYALASSALTKT